MAERPENRFYAAARWAAYAEHLEARLAECEAALREIDGHVELAMRPDHNTGFGLAVIRHVARAALLAAQGGEHG